MEMIGSVFLALLVIALLFILLLAINSILNIGSTRLVLIMVLFTIGFSIYFVGFVDSVPTISTFSAALFQSVQMFVINNNTETMVNPLVTNSPLLLSIIRIISIVLFYIVSQFIIATVFSEYMNVLAVRLNQKQEVIYFFGFKEKYTHFVKECITKKQRVVCLDYQGLDKKTLPKLINVILEKRLPIAFLKAPKKIRAFFLYEDETKNLSLAKGFLKTVGSKSSVEVHVSIKHEYLRYSLEEEHKEGIEINFIDEAHMITRSALQKKPIVDQIEVDTSSATFVKPLIAFISGLQHLGMAFFKEFVINGQSPTAKPKLYLAAKDNHYFQGQLISANPSITEAVDITFFESEIGSIEYCNQLKMILPECQYLVFSHPDEEKNIELATAVIRMGNTMNLSHFPVILCYVSSEEANDFYANLPEFSSVTFFGKNSDIFKKEFLIYDQLDFEAKRYHEVYESQKEKAKLAKNKPYYPNPWSRLHIFSIYSNRVLIDSIPIKLKLLGMISREECSKRFSDVAQFKTFIGNRLETLTKLEHLRWNALHFVNGFTPMTIEEAKKREPLFANMSEIEARRFGSPTKDLILRKHVCLVDFEKLADLETAFNEPYILYDENNITHIPEIIHMIQSNPQDNQA